MSKLDLSKLRNEYSRHELSPEECLEKPLDQLALWLDEAVKAQVNEPTAMNIATVDTTGRPSARVVLCKGIENGRIVFYTNYESRKGTQISSNPNVALTFFWPELERQVRIEGVVEVLPSEISDDYFASRPYASRIGAWASLQSEELTNKAQLVGRVAQYSLKFVGHVPRPPHWGGYGVIPCRVEFWQGRPSRLHDRVLYEHDAEGHWHRKRLYP